MNEVTSKTEGFEQALETITQHYFTLHVDLRLEIISIIEEVDILNSAIAMRNSKPDVGTQSIPDSEPPESPEYVKPAPKSMKEIYLRICNMCHPDKIGYTDSTLVSLMQEAKDALRNREAEQLDGIYDRVKMYTVNPTVYTTIEKEARITLERETNPWYKVYEYHSQGDIEKAFHESRLILSSNLAQRRLDISNLRLFAQHLGLQL